jgi:hypothetical protein
MKRSIFSYVLFWKSSVVRPTLCGNQTAHRTEADDLTGPLWRLDRPLSNGLKSSRVDGQLILIMLINCIIIIS